MFRFTIRDVLWLTVVVALVVGWWVTQSRQMVALESAVRERIAAEHREARAEVESRWLGEELDRLRGRVAYLEQERTLAKLDHP